MEKRTNKVFLIAGTRGTGKTDFIKNIIAEASKSFNKTLVVDTFDNPAWKDLSTWNHPDRLTQVPVIPLTKFPVWKKGIGKIYSSNTKELMATIQEYAKNTFVVFEDATRYIGSKLTDDVNNFVLDSKQKNLDLVFIFHSLMSIPPDLVRVADILILFKTNEGKIPEYKYPWPEIPIAMKELKKSSNRYMYKIIPLN